MTNIEPGSYDTDWLAVGPRQSTPIAAYNRLRADTDAFEIGDPEATVSALFAVVEAQEPPLRVFFGKSFEPVRAEHMARIAEWERWQDVALSRRYYNWVGLGALAGRAVRGRLRRRGAACSFVIETRLVRTLSAAGDALGGSSTRRPGTL